MKLDRILLTTDFSDCAREAYRPAAEFAGTGQTSITLVHVFEWLRSWEVTHPRHSDINELRKHVEGQLEKEAGHEAFSGVNVTTQLLSGYGPAEISRYAESEHFDLLVMSSHGYSGIRHFFLGSFAERVLRDSPIPVLTHKVSRFGPRDYEPNLVPQKIVLPYDFSTVAAQAVGAARCLAERFGAEVTAAYVIDTATDVRRTAKQMADMAQIARQNLDRFIEGSLQGIRAKAEVLKGPAATVLIALAASSEADLICMSTHGRTGLKRVLMGSVAEKVVRGAACPVLTVRCPRETLRDYPPEVERLLASCL